MAQTWAAKAASDVKRYSWDVPLQDGDSLLSVSSSAAGATIDAESTEDNSAVFYVSGGTNATTATFTLSALTSQGETLTETIYLPIVATTNAVTVASIVDFALRPIIGIGGTATDDEKSDALEWLNDMLAEWGLTGGNIGAAFPLAIGDTAYMPAAWAAGVKLNLRLYVAEQYGRQVAPATISRAMRGLQTIKFSLLNDGNDGAEYY